MPRTKISFSREVGVERLLLLGVRLLPRRRNAALASDIETDRLWLRCISGPQLWVQLAPWHRDPELMENLRRHSGPMPLFKWLRSTRWPNKVRRFCYAIVPKGHGKPVGVVYMNLNKEGDPGATTHIAISDPAWRGRQVSVEARRALLTLFFDNGVTHVTAEPAARNLGSVFVYKKLGFRVVEVVHYGPVGGGSDTLRLLLTREEWRDRQARAAAPSQPADASR